MSDSGSIQDGLSFADRQRIDQVCDRFESELLAGKHPQIDQHVDDLPEHLLTPGLIELVILDASYASHSTNANSVTERKNWLSGASDAVIESEVVWEQYVDRFPALAGIDLPEEFCSAIQQRVIDGRFQTRHAHAAGGLGQVSIATDLQIHRDVAIKEIHDKYASDPEIRRRFLREAEITGQLEHPGIVPVYAAGHHANGEPYYAMRLIGGKRMTDAIEECQALADRETASRARRQLLRRFTDVCNTIEYAHSRQIIHRDIKPHNIMLGDFGETLVVDWGLAKSLTESVTAQTDSNGDENTVPDVAQHTRLGTVMGTPGYMSPEQAAGENQSVNRLSDIYSLGATLLHLLTGSPPTPLADSESVQQHDQRIQRLLEDAGVPRDLMAVCQTALRADAADRYASAGALAIDIERFLADEPVTACRESRLHRWRRYLKKHPALAAASLATVLLTITGLIAWSLLTAAHSREIQSQNLQLDKLVRNEQRLRAAAETSEHRTENALQFITNALRSPDPDLAGRDVRVVDVLKSATNQLGQDFPDDPLLQARILNATGHTLFQLGEYESAAELHQDAHQLYLEYAGQTDRQALIAGKNLGRAWLKLGDRQAIPLLTETWKSSRAAYGDEHPLTLGIELELLHGQLETGQSETAMQRLQQLVPIYRRVFGDDAAELESLRGSLARAWTRIGQPLKAAEIYHQVYQARIASHGPHSLSAITAGSNYANALLATNEKSQAVELMEYLLADARKQLGREHFTTVILTRKLGTFYLEHGQRERGIELVEEAFRQTRQRYGRRHRLSLSSANALGIAQIAAGQYVQAAEHLQETWQDFIAVHGPVHSETLTCANNVAMAYRSAGRHEQAISVFREVLDKQTQHLGEQHPLTVRTMVNLGGTLHDVNRHADSIPLLQRASELASRIEPNHKWYQTSLSLIAAAHLKLGENDRALAAISECYQSRSQTMPEHWLTYHTMSVLGEVLMNLGQLKDAEPYLVQGAEKLAALDSKIPVRAKFRIADAKKRLDRLHELQKTGADSR